MATEKNVEYYMHLPYTFEIIREDEETWFAAVKELTGCMTEADSPEEAVTMLQDAMLGWLEVSLEDGAEIPEPQPEPDYSGRFNLRVPRSLHRDLALAAEREGVSLNQYVVSELSRAVGRGEPPVAQTTQKRAAKPRKPRQAQVRALHEEPSAGDAYRKTK